MELKREELPEGIDLITLVGRLDIAGAQAIDLPFTTMASSRKAWILVDVSQVTFLASIGIRTLVSSAKAQARRGGRIVLASPQPMVEDVLKLAGIDSLIPVFADVDSARADLRKSSAAA